ncbi:MAG TPA: ATP-binding protein [Vicinamibacterales bacterium]|jgi:two-component system NtrC family sensor kinase|nr:ATP-binding protein [Vicinamibacterales bacterium]
MTSARLLVLADDPALVRLFSSPAAGHRYEVTAATGLAALADSQSCPHDVVIVDLTSCADAGPEAIRLVRRRCSDTEIVILVSSTTSVTSAIASYDLAAFAVVAKPFDGDQLLSTIAQAAERTRITQANRRLVWELKVINDIGEDLRRSLDPTVLLETGLRRLLEAFQGHSGSVHLIGLPMAVRGSASIEVGPATAIDALWKPAHGQRPIDRVLATGQAVEVRDYAGLIDVDPATLPIRCSLHVPMCAGDEMIGVLSLGSGTPARFGEDDRQLIQTVANHLAIAVQNARLHAVARAGKQQWEATFDAIGDPIAVFDRHGRLLRGNTALASCLGRPVTSLRGLTCDEIGLCGAPYPDCGVGRPFELAAQRREVTRADEQIFSVTTCPVVADGDGAAVVQVAKNVTQEIRSARRLLQMSEELSATNARLLATVDRLKATQAQLLQAEKLSAIGQLVAGVAHELNNPLTSVIGYAQLVEEELRDAGDAPVRASSELAHDVRRIAEESERAAKIVRNLLAFARRQTAARAPQDIADLTLRVLSLRSYEFRLNTIEVETEFEQGLPRVLADAGQLQQALLNLVLNAEQAMRSRTTKRLRVGARYDDAAGAVELFVGDTGHGISDDNLPRIFDPFFTTRDVGEGTGLGLSICYGIVRDHGGQIAVKSRVGEGTTFSLLLPAIDRDPLTTGPIVVAHGDPVDREYISAALAGWGLGVEAFDQPAAALARLRRGNAGVVFAERAFVDGDGGAWSAALAASPQRPSLVLLVRPQSDEQNTNAEWKPDAVLAPPFELRAVRDVLRAVSRECV